MHRQAPRLSQIPYFIVEAPTCFDSYNKSRLGGGRFFAIELWNAQFCLPNSVVGHMPREISHLLVLLEKES